MDDGNYYEDRVSSLINGIIYSEICFKAFIYLLQHKPRGSTTFGEFAPYWGHEWTLGGKCNEVKLPRAHTGVFKEELHNICFVLFCTSAL